MMIPILIDSRKPGSSSWVFCRRSTREVLVSGLEPEDKLWIILGSMEGEARHLVSGIKGQMSVEVPEGTYRVRAVHDTVSNGSEGVYVEMTNGRFDALSNGC